LNLSAKGLSDIVSNRLRHFCQPLVKPCDFRRVGFIIKSHVVRFDGGINRIKSRVVQFDCGINRIKASKDSLIRILHRMQH
jgi:hypothetical protein